MVLYTPNYVFQINTVSQIIAQILRLTATNSYHSNEAVVIARRITLASPIDSLGGTNSTGYLSMRL